MALSLTDSVHFYSVVFQIFQCQPEDLLQLYKCVFYPECAVCHKFMVNIKLRYHFISWDSNFICTAKSFLCCILVFSLKITIVNCCCTSFCSKALLSY